MTFFFVVISALLLASALGVVLARNPIFSALSLILHLVGVAVVFAALQAHFLAVVQVIVYAGAIMVLVVFVLMLLSSKQEEQQLPGLFLLLLSAGAAAVFIGMFSFLVLEAFPDGVRLRPEFAGTVNEIGKLLFTKYVFPFEAAAVLLLAAVVGAAMVAKEDRKQSREEK